MSLPSDEPPIARLPNGRRRTVLIAQSRPGATSQLIDVMRDHQWSVLNGTGPAPCLLLAEKFRPDLILIDAVGAILFALDLLHSLRSSEIAGGIAIIVIGAPANEVDEIRALDAGADDFVTMPLQQQQLFLRAQGIIHSRSLLQDDVVLQYADISIDVSRHTVLRDGVRIRLRPVQFRLLRYFITEPGHIFSRKAISQMLWPGQENLRLSRTIDVHIRLLRQKLNQGGRPDPILTARGGYGCRLANEILNCILKTNQNNGAKQI